MSAINPNDMVVSAKNPDPSNNLTMLSKVGEGSYGAVYKVMHKVTSTIAALKIVPVDQENGETIEDLTKEIEVMKGLNHKGIVQLYGSWYLEEKLWMLIEYCAAGSVSDIMKVCKCTMKEQEIACIIRQTLEGLAYLHERKKIHRDIKAGNILINDKGEAKLADFGVAGQLSDSVAKRNTVIGTPFWMAPEIIQEVGYNTAADIWSIGITCIEMYDGHPPYHNIHPMRAIFIIPSKPSATLENPSKVSDAFNKFIARCLTKNADLRPSALEMLKDPFMVNAPSVNSGVLSEKVASAIELISQGKLNSDSDDEEEQTGTESSYASTNGQTMMTSKRGGPKTVSDTMMSTNGSNIAQDFGTMVINDSISGTMIQNKNGDYKPPFLNAKDKIQPEDASGTIKPNKTKQKQSSNDNLSFGTIKQAAKNKSNGNLIGDQQDANAPSFDELSEMLKALETSMEKEIAMIKTKYDRKKEPILEALKQKKGGQRV